VQDGHPTLAATEAIVPPPEPSPPSSPRKVLILSGEMGEGHNAAAAAITEAIADVWPGCEVERFDTLELWGRPFSRFMSRGYEIQIRLLPLTYEVFYDALCASRGFAALSKLAIGSFFGRRLQDFLKSHDADLVISTYPFGSAALHWLRTHQSYRVPAVTYIPAFHVHPVWAYAGIDQHYVMYDTAPDHAATAGFEQTMRVGAPPVRSGFGTVSKKDARERLGLHPQRFILLTTGGAWGLGGIDEAVQALTESEIEHLQVIAVCGKSTKLLHQLQQLGVPGERLRTYGYVTNMHEIMAAADVVVTNGAGVTVLEALRTPRPVIAFKPLAGHGKASTDEMMRRDLALVANDVAQLVSVVRELATDQVLMARMEHAGREWCRDRELLDSVRGMNDLFPGVSADVHL
jgi:UDP-N-acetylglucosamine:LPS N-acetylglucosamine transferase